MIDSSFWRDKRVLVTGHTGFKGSWLCLWLKSMGAEVCGLALPPESPSMFEICHMSELVNSKFADIGTGHVFEDLLPGFAPDVVFHLAAQPLVRASYQSPVETYRTNVMGTVHLLEALRTCPTVRSIVIITTDKCYQPSLSGAAFAENARLGGKDPYSSSKACAELAVQAYREAFYSQGQTGAKVGIATARAGNVIGGGDWAVDRLIPDCIRAFQAGKTIKVRNPAHIRPWQHVLEPLTGYLMLAQRLFEAPCQYQGAWNFGPCPQDEQSVGKVVALMTRALGINSCQENRAAGPQQFESPILRLDCAKAQTKLGWYPIWPLEKAIQHTAEWYLAHHQGKTMRPFALEQIRSFIQDGNNKHESQAG